MLRITEDIVEHALKNKISDPVTFAKETFRPDFDVSTLEKQSDKPPVKQPAVNLNLFFQIDDYIQSKKKQVSPKMIAVYRNLKDTLQAFEIFRGKPITFDSFDFTFYEEFVDYMMYEHVQRRRKEIIKGFRISTVGKIIKQLRIFVRNRMRKKIISPINLDDFKILDEETDAIYLTRAEIGLIYQADLSAHPHLEKYRIYWCLVALPACGFRIFPYSFSRCSEWHALQKTRKIRSLGSYSSTGRSAVYFCQEIQREYSHYYKPGLQLLYKGVGKLRGITQLIKFSHKKGNQDVISVKPKYAWMTSHTSAVPFAPKSIWREHPLIYEDQWHKSLRDFTGTSVFRRRPGKRSKSFGDKEET